MTQYIITGMSCAACSARVQRAVSAVDGVTECSVSLLTNSMSYEGCADEDAIISAVKAAGYGIYKKGSAECDEKSAQDSQGYASRALLRRFILSLVLLLPLMYLSMGHNMWGFPLPRFLEKHPSLIGIIQLLLSLAVMLINNGFFISGIKGLVRRAPNMDTLVSLGSLSSFGYSVYVLIMLMLSDTPSAYLHDLYFESCAMILTLITLGKLLEARTKGKTTDAIRGLMDLAPKTACVVRDGDEVLIPACEVRVGDVFVVRQGQSIPTDGIIIDGHCAVDESVLTGESIPREVTVGDEVSGACVNTSGFIKCKASRVGEDTTLFQIIKMVTDASATKAPIAKVADRVAGIFVPTVMAISALVLAVWLLVGAGVGQALTHAVAVLVISCPCALGLATPVAIMVGSGKGARCGILYKTAASLEAAGRVDTVVLDKTGTLTKGAPEVTDIIGDESLLSVAYALEIRSEHPIAGAVIRRARADNIPLMQAENFEAFAGGGVCATLDGCRIYGGSFDFISRFAKIPDDLSERARALASEGKTQVFFAREAEVLGIIAVLDEIKEDSRSAVTSLVNMGMRVVMLTGDARATAEAIGKEVGIDEIISDVKPDGKEATIRELQRSGTVAMVGDGINDAPSLARADLGVAIGAGSDIAIDSADAVIVNSRLSDAVSLFRLGRRTLRTIRQNLFFAFIYNVICIPIAAGAFVWAGVSISPMLGAAAMSMSSLCVVSNALRLNLFAPTAAAKTTKEKREETNMKRVIKIEGMMCPHCEARVREVLSSLDGVTEALVSHKDGTATVIADASLTNDKLIKVITDNGYKVTDIS